MIHLLARALVFLSITLGGSFAFLAMTTPGNSTVLSIHDETPNAADFFGMVTVESIAH